VNLLEKIQQEFHSYEHSIIHEKESPYLKMRKDAFDAFQHLGFPTTKNEEWKYTSFKAIADKAFESNIKTSVDIKSLLSQNEIYSLPFNKLVFVNGIFDPSLSIVIEKDSTIFITNILKAQLDHSSVFTKHFGKYAKFENDSMNALNTALASDGAFVYVPERKIVEHPILIFNISDSTDTNVLIQPRNLIVIENSASVKLVETYFSIGSCSSFTNTVSEIYVGENAHLEHYKIQNQTGASFQNNYTQLFQEANTNINHITLTLDGTLVRNNLHFYMNGENCNSLLYGLYVTANKNHVDNHTRVDHAKPNCYSNELYKGILKDQSTAVFNGKIMVHLDAQKTNAYQRNQNVLLSDEAMINTKPQLEIFADDVKCTHGATVGQLNDEAMFYLRSRGIPENEARKMLLNAFADEIAELIKISELVSILEQEISNKL
jgi:Fe-S cluster assembly protein SufD